MKIRIADVFRNQRVSRKDGALLRQMIVESWDEKDQIVLDFQGVRIASVSFLDEAIGLLAREHSLDDLTQRISIENICDADRNLLNGIVLSRSGERGRKVGT